jgi:hypothetical protein
MLAIGRALMTNPKLLILDEATEGLAPVVRGEKWRCVEALKSQGQSILLIDKNMHALKRLADHISWRVAAPFGAAMPPLLSKMRQRFNSTSGYDPSGDTTGLLLGSRQRIPNQAYHTGILKPHTLDGVKLAHR